MYFYCLFLDLDQWPASASFFNNSRGLRQGEKELRWMSEEVHGYVEVVLNSLAANIPKVHGC